MLPLGVQCAAWFGQPRKHKQCHFC